MPRRRHAGWPHRALRLFAAAAAQSRSGRRSARASRPQANFVVRRAALGLDEAGWRGLYFAVSFRSGYQQIVARSWGSIEALSDRPALKFPSSETPDVQMISVQTRPDPVARELDLDFGLVCRHQFCADRARHTSSGSGQECAIGCSARQFSVKHRCARLFATHCFGQHLGASRSRLTAEGKTPRG